MEVLLRLALPRDQLSIPVVRRILDRAMEVLGVEVGDRSDIEVAITEACTNVLDHAVEGDDYEVTCGINDRGCQIRVLDRGLGFDGRPLPLPDPTSEEGRGVLLMRALVDRVRFDCREEEGTVVSLEKRLHYVAGSPAERLAEPEVVAEPDALD